MEQAKNIILISVSVAILSLSFSFPASAKNCKKGIPCGNSCISASKTCRIGTGYSSSSNTYKRNNNSISSSLYSRSSNDSSKYKSKALKASSLAIAGASITSVVAASSSDLIKYRCSYAKAAIKNGVVGEMRGFSLANVEVNGDIFKANRPDKTTITSPAMKKKNGNLFIETKDKIAYVMADTRNDFAVSDGEKQITEQWTECR